MDMSSELQDKLDKLESNIQTMIRGGNRRTQSYQRLVSVIKRRNFALISDDGLKRITRLVDIMIEETATD